MDSFVLLVYASLAASRTLLEQLLACLKFNLDSENLFYWYKWKKWVLWAMEGAQAAENHHGHEWGLTWYLWWRLKFTSSSRSPKFKDILPWNTSQMITKTNQQEISHKLCDETGYDTSMQWNWDNNMIRFSNEEKTIVEQILWNEMKYILFNKIYISLLQFQVISENKTLGNL